MQTAFVSLFYIFINMKPWNASYSSVCIGRPRPLWHLTNFFYEFLRIFLISKNSLKFANFFCWVTNSRSMIRRACWLKSPHYAILCHILINSPSLLYFTLPLILETESSCIRHSEIDSQLPGLTLDQWVHMSAWIKLSQKRNRIESSHFYFLFFTMCHSQ